MSNRYKEYFNNISPDTKLTEDTLRKMREEMSAEKKRIRFDIRPFAAVAACAAFTVSAILLAPDLKNSGNSNPDNNAVAENAVVTTVPSVSVITSLSEKYTSSEIKSADYAVSETSVSVMSSVTLTEQLKLTEKPQSSQTSSAAVSSGSSVSKDDTVQPAVTEVPASSAENGNNTSESVSSEVSQQVSGEISAVVTSLPEPQATVPVSGTSRPDLRPGSNGHTTETSVPENVLPEVTTKRSDLDYYRSEQSGDISVSLNYGIGYYCPVPRSSSPRSQEYIEQTLGVRVIPDSISENFGISSSYSDSQDPWLEKGVCITIGNETELDSYSGKFISIAAASEEPYYGFDQKYFSSETTEINGINYFFGINNDLPDVYFCRFSSNGINYKMVFKGYSLDEAVSFVIQF